MKKMPLIGLMMVLMAQWSLYAKESANRRVKKQVSVEKTDSATPKTMSTYHKITFGAKRSEGFINVLQKGQSTYLEIPDSIMGRDLLLGCRVAAISNNRTISAGQMRNNPVLFRFKREGEWLLVVKPALRNTVDPLNPIAPSVALNNIEPIAHVFDISATQGDTYLVEITKFFSEEVDLVWPPDLSKVGRLESKIGGIQSAKAYKKNVEIVSHYNYTGAREPFAVTMNYSILLLSKEPMRERYSDTRIGFMNNSKRIYSIEGPVESRRFISRFRIEPKPEEVELHRQGELVEPANPIVFYIDTVMPPLYRKYARQGIEVWNRAFEAIGFKNVIRAYDYPNDPNFSSNDITKNCLHYIATEQENASGPSWTDPRSGEIIQADILWYHNITNLLQRWRFIQTAAADPAARKKVLDEEVMGELIRYAVSHEMGHCLGLQHNMRSSFAYSVDSLRSPHFTQKYGTTASIMDYARNNHVAQPGDAERGVRMTPPDLGPFDLFSIAYGYKPIYDATTPQEELPYLNSMFTEKGNNPMYLFAPMSVGTILPDPSAQSDALSNDLIRSGNLAIQNLKYILSHLLDWRLDEGDEYAKIDELTDDIHKQYMRYLTLAASNIGGVYTFPGTSGHHEAKYVPVDKQTQQATVQFIFGHLRETHTWANPAELTSLIGDKTDALIKRQSDLLANMLSTNMMSRLLSHTNHTSASGYTATEYLQDIATELFKVKAHDTLNYYQMALQTAYVQRLVAIVESALNTDKSDARPTTELLSGSVAMQALQKVEVRIKELIAQGGNNRGHYLLLQKIIQK